MELEQFADDRKPEPTSRHSPFVRFINFIISVPNVCQFITRDAFTAVINRNAYISGGSDGLRNGYLFVFARVIDSIIEQEDKHSYTKVDVTSEGVKTAVDSADKFVNTAIKATGAVAGSKLSLRA